MLEGTKFASKMRTNSIEIEDYHKTGRLTCFYPEANQCDALLPFLLTKDNVILLKLQILEITSSIKIDPEPGAKEAAKETHSIILQQYDSMTIFSGPL